MGKDSQNNNNNNNKGTAARTNRNRKWTLCAQEKRIVTWCVWGYPRMCMCQGRGGRVTVQSSSLSLPLQMQICSKFIECT
ncbi:hypothetical protein M5D96_004414 [Drosophila gunungcola]|uniref:Uncharacterized protein n=1 Tax=Drosophila gunungcola TaxID=103775 RepID=A0A9P9YUL8_9MUSC|nr:hypothetical protein M5D96_004414 [Drosophila gunungcola]